jgi:hypothetical protein
MPTFVRKRGRLAAAPSALAKAPTIAVAAMERPSARARGYTSKWDKASLAFLAVHPLCRGCEAVGRTEAATLTDHVVPHRGDMARFWDRAWWQASCEWHHNVVKKILEAMFDAGTIGCDDLWLDSATAVAIARREGD